MTINTLKLHKALEAAGIPIFGVDSNGGIDFKLEATPEQHALAAQILAAHDPTDPTIAELEQLRAAWMNSPYAGKSPAQIYTLIESRIDGWLTANQAVANLTQAKALNAQVFADFRELLPLLTAAIRVFGRSITENI